MIVAVIALFSVGIFAYALYMYTQDLKRDLAPHQESIRLAFKNLSHECFPSEVDTFTTDLKNEFGFHIDRGENKLLISGIFRERKINIWSHRSYLGIILETDLRSSKRKLLEIKSILFPTQFKSGYYVDGNRMIMSLYEENVTQLNLEETVIQFCKVCDDYENPSRNK